MTAPVRPSSTGPGSSSTLLRLRQQATDVMAGFSSGQKAMVGVAVLAVVLGGYLFMSWAGQPSYVPLFSNLSSADAASITQKLATNKVPYELTEGGEQIMVPSADVYQQRLDMAADGLPSSGDQGYSLLDTAGVTTSEFQQQVEYQQAVSDELEQTIESITGVNSAQVSVVIPQESLFTSSSDQPSASVLVSLDPGSSLTAEQVQAIVHLVASSVEGLSPDNVTVADSNGDVLNAPGTDAGNVAAGSMDQQETSSYDQEIDNSLQDMLATVLGPGNAVVHASAQLDFDQTQISSQIYNPNNQAPIPVQQASSKETYTGANASQAAQGILGAGSATTLSGERRKHSRHDGCSDGVGKDHQDDQDDQGRQNGRGDVELAHHDGPQRLHHARDNGAELCAGRQLPVKRRERGHQDRQLGPRCARADVGRGRRQQFGQGCDPAADNPARLGRSGPPTVARRQHPGRLRALRPDAPSSLRPLRRRPPPAPPARPP